MSEAISHAAAAHAARTSTTSSSFIRTYVFSTDHKMIGKQFLFMGLVHDDDRRPAGAAGALGAGVAGDARCRACSWVPEPYMYDGIIPPKTYNALLHHARHDHDLLRGHADPGRLLRQLPHPADDRRARHGVPAAQHAVVLDRRGRPASSCCRASSCRAAPPPPAGRRTRRSQRGAGLHRRRLGPEPLVHQPDRARRLVADGLDQLHHHHHQHARAGHDAGSACR